MKANKLMVGDYISVKPSAMPIKIAAVHHKKVAYHAYIHRLEWVRESLLEPIPLTPEILEKNGFIDCHTIAEKYELRINLDKKIGGEYQVVSYYVACGELSIKTEYSYYMHPTIESLRIEYVHQLQQVLRLCNIQKEIVL